MKDNTYISLLFVGVFCRAIAFWLWSEGLARQTAGEVDIYLYVEPLITVVGAWALIGESITIWLVVGGVLISIGVYIAEKYGAVKVAEHDV